MKKKWTKQEIEQLSKDIKMTPFQIEALFWMTFGYMGAKIENTGKSAAESRLSARTFFDAIEFLKKNA